MKKEHWKTVITVISGLIALISVAINLRSYFVNEPNIELSFDKIDIKSNKFSADDIPTELNGIESELGDFTLDKIKLLKTNFYAIENLSDSDNGLRDFNLQLQNTIDFFNTEVEPWEYTDIKYNNGLLTWPDGFSINLLKKDFYIDHYFKDIKDIKDIIDDVRDGRNTLSNHQIKKLLQASYDLNKINDEVIDHRKTISKKLRSLRERLEDIINNNTTSIQLSCFIENKSRQPNMVNQHALLRVYKDKNIYKDVSLEVAPSKVLHGYEIGNFTLISKPLSKIDEEKKDFVLEAIEKDYNCMVFIEDIHGKVWNANGLFSRIKSFNHSKSFKKEVEKAFANLE